MQYGRQQDTWKQLAAEAAVQFIEDGMVLGLGTGSTATCMIYALARRIADGLYIAGAVPTSQATARLASSLGIPLTDLDTHAELDLAIDGADQIDNRLNLIKGGGGALLREKIVAAASRRFIVVGDVTKQVMQLGHQTPLPVEAVPSAATPVSKRLEAFGATVQLRRLGASVYLTEHGNVILDCCFANGIVDPTDLEDRIRRIVGVVETGLFLHMAEQAIIGGPAGVQSFTGRFLGGSSEQGRKNRGRKNER